MSTFGTAFVVDVPAVASQRVGTALAGVEADVDATPLEDGWVRLAGYSDDVEAPGQVVEAVLSGLEGARAVLAEDFDEYGARFRVVVAQGGVVRVVYQAYVLNADPGDAGEVEAALGDHDQDPRAEDLTGHAAARAAAEVFGVDPQAMVEADRTYPSTAWEQIGAVGGPFPWWDALRLDWPG